MTDEEKLAEEYVKNVIDVNAFDWKIVREIGLAFLAGLKAGRPKWHKVADGDLPLVHATFLNEDCDKVEYVGKGKWEEYSDYHERYVEARPPIAWCELPKFEEE